MKTLKTGAQMRAYGTSYIFYNVRCALIILQIHPPVILTIFSLSFASSPGSSSPVPVHWRPEEVAVLAVAPVGAIVLLRLMCGERRRVRPPVSPVRRSPVGFAFLSEAFFWLMALQPIHHFNGHLRERKQSAFKDNVRQRRYL